MLSEDEKTLFDKVAGGSRELQKNLLLWLRITEAHEKMMEDTPMNPHFPGSPGDDPRLKGPGWDPMKPIIMGTGENDRFYDMWMHGHPMGVHIMTPFRLYIDEFGGNDYRPIEAAIVGFDGGGPVYGTVPAKHIADGSLRNRPLIGELTHDGNTHSFVIDPTKVFQHNKPEGLGINKEIISKITSEGRAQHSLLEAFAKINKSFADGHSPEYKSIRRKFITGLITGAVPTSNSLISDNKKFDPNVLQQLTGEKNTSKKHKKRRK